MSTQRPPPNPTQPVAQQPPSAPAGTARPAGERPPPRRRGRLAIGMIQLIALVGIIGLAVLAGAILVEDTGVPGWIDGLAIGAGSMLLTLVVLVNGRRARRP